MKLNLPVKLMVHLPVAAYMLVSFAVSALAQAQNVDNPPINVPQEFNGGITGFFELVKKLIGWMLAFSLLIGVVFIIIGGITYVTAGGNADKAKDGAKYVGFSLLGIAIMVLAYALVNLVASIFTAHIDTSIDRSTGGSN